MFTILLVDDDRAVLNTLKRTLRRKTYKILCSESGLKALDLLKHQPVDLIISDLRMTQLSGVELLSTVKREHPRTYRILLSGYNDFSTVTQAFNEGIVQTFFEKPWDDTKLFRLINEISEKYK